jgi:hypothetical protein
VVATHEADTGAKDWRRRERASARRGFVRLGIGFAFLPLLAYLYARSPIVTPVNTGAVVTGLLAIGAVGCFQLYVRLLPRPDDIRVVGEGVVLRTASRPPKLITWADWSRQEASILARQSSKLSAVPPSGFRMVLRKPVRISFWIPESVYQAIRLGARDAGLAEAVRDWSRWTTRGSVRLGTELQFRSAGPSSPGESRGEASEN